MEMFLSNSLKSTSMKITPRCFGCFLNQAIEVCTIAHADMEMQNRVIKSVCGILGSASLDVTPPEISNDVHRVIRETLGVHDPYAAIKRTYNENALKYYHNSKILIEKSDSPLEMAIRFSIAGNVIDFGCEHTFDLDETLSRMHTWNIPKDTLSLFAQQLATAKSLLFLADNCGEVVFDRLLIEHITSEYGIGPITFAIKGGPWINDAMYEDVEMAGITKLSSVRILNIDTGVPNTGIARQSPEFDMLLKQYDVVISKGQANWEMLSDKKNIFFLLMIKCTEIARELGRDIGEAVFFTKG